MKAAVMRALLEAGTPAAAIVAACEAEEKDEAERLARRRELAADRQRRKRARAAAEPELFETQPVASAEPQSPLCHAESRVTERDNPPPKKVPPITPSKNYPLPIDDDGGGRPAPKSKSLISPEAVALAAELREIAGIEDIPPAWHSAAMQIQAWLNEGAEIEIIRCAARASMARKRDGPPLSVKYFEREIARQRASLAVPLPNVVSITGQPIHAEKSKSVAASRDRIIAKLRAGQSPL